MKLRLAKIVRGLGYDATAGHRPTNADVFVHEPAWCLEVQLHPTQFRKRTAQRKAKGAAVCWLIREGSTVEPSSRRSSVSRRCGSGDAELL
jgi:hypothetical protein